MSAVPPAVDLTPIIDRQKVGAFHVKLIIIAFLVVMADGYDIGAAAFAGPALIREWHVSPQALGGMFSAGLFAGFFGPLILGRISDRYGRRTARSHLFDRMPSITARIDIVVNLSVGQ